jgi:hypothetical protein
MASAAGGGIGGEPLVQIYEDRTWQVTFPEGVAAGTTVEIPADVSENHLLPTSFDPRRIDKGRNYPFQAIGIHE